MKPMQLLFYVWAVATVLFGALAAIAACEGNAMGVIVCILIGAASWFVAAEVRRP